jgi:cell division septation protein DedD
MSFTNTIFKILEEQNILRTSKTKPIVDAIKNRNKISFYYSGPTKPAKDSVKPGKRIDAEAVALGLSKRGNLVVRAYVQPPSVSKKGFNKTGWRTFMVGRMSDLKVSDNKFDQKRPDYKEGDDNSMSVTYVTTDWTNKPEVKKPRIIKPSTPKPTTPTTEPTEPTPTEPEVTTPQEPKTTELPQPKPQTKPEPAPQDTVDKGKELYKAKEADWINKQKEVGGNTKPGQGTRERFKKEVEKELPQPKPTEKPVANPEEDEENKNLQESIKNIKRLMFS